MAQVHQVLATLSYGDAIGHEALGIQRALRAAGHASDIFVETAHPKVEGLTRDYRELRSAVGPDDLLIHHFSIGSEASRVAFASAARMILVYHNITPPEYFLGINDELVKRCYHGRRELAAYAGRCELALGDSEFNRRELEALGFPRTAVLPVVPDFSHLDVEPDPLLAGQFDDDWTNILFVGRVIPNKRFDDVIRFFHAYRLRFNTRSRLLLVGSTAGVEDHRTQLLALVGRLGTPDVHLTGHVTGEQLVAFYEVADLFLSASEHEGFCVPIVEAFYMEVPVLAYAAAAVPETLDGGGMLYETKDPLDVAGLMDGVVRDRALRERVLASQEAALERLTRRDFAGTLRGFVDRTLAASRQARYGVASDFWQQFDSHERLAALKKIRPALYEALPEARGQTLEARGRRSEAR
jgi:glycosyltransferase involved in cell wall biosynthesis